MSDVSIRFEEKFKKKIKKTALGCLIPILLSMSVPLILVLFFGGGEMALVPSIEDEQLSELQRVATYCGVNWEEILTYYTVMNYNDFEEFDIEALVIKFISVKVDEYRQVVIPGGEDAPPVIIWVHVGTYYLETPDDIKNFVNRTGGNITTVTNMVDHIRRLHPTQEYDTYINSKDMYDFYGNMDEEQLEWYNALLSENVILETFGEYFELPETIIVDATGYFAWPVPNFTRVTSPFGWREDPVYGGTGFHKGIDISSPGCLGEPVISVAAGRVVSVQYKTTGYGYVVLLEHSDSDGNVWQTRYAHLNQISVDPGQFVDRGTVVGAVGSTGKSTGPHLHFEIIYQGSPVDPLLFYQN